MILLVLAGVTLVFNQDAAGETIAGTIVGGILGYWLNRAEQNLLVK